LSRDPSLATVHTPYPCRAIILLESLAATAGYSAFHFARKFALAMGISSGRYISQRRLENAPNAQFSSQASFTRAFHRVAGTTPKEYRRRQRA
jgi:AraC family transcriptional regulator